MRVLTILIHTYILLYDYRVARSPSSAVPLILVCVCVCVWTYMLCNILYPFVESAGRPLCATRIRFLYLYIYIYYCTRSFVKPRGNLHNIILCTYVYATTATATATTISPVDRPLVTVTVGGVTVRAEGNHCVRTAAAAAIGCERRRRRRRRPFKAFTPPPRTCVRLLCDATSDCARPAHCCSDVSPLMTTLINNIRREFVSRLCRRENFRYLRP